MDRPKFLPKSLLFIVDYLQGRVLPAEKVRAPAFISGVVVGVLYITIATLSYLGSEFDASDFARLVVGSLLISYAILFYIKTLGRDYVPVFVLASSSFAFLVTAPVFACVFLAQGNALSQRMTISMVLGLFLHYGMLGLHPKISVSLGVAASIISVFALLSLEATGVLNAAMYLVAANLVGGYMCNCSVRRDLSEAMAKNQLKENWSKLSSARVAFDHALAEHKRWVSTIAHEVYQPIYASTKALSSTREKISMGEPKDLALKQLEKIEDNIKDLESIISSIISRSILDFKSARLRLRWISLEEIIGLSIEQMVDIEPSISERILISSKVGSHVFIFSDPHYLLRVFRNILENGLKYSKETDGVVKVRIYARNKGLCINIINSVDVLMEGVPVDSLRGSNLKLGLGLRLGSEFLRGVNEILPGLKIKSRPVSGAYWVSRISVGKSFVLTGELARNIISASGRTEVLLFADDSEFICSFAERAGIENLSLSIRPFMDLSEQIDFYLNNLSGSESPVFVIFVSHSMVPAVEFFGPELNLKLMGFGCNFFISNFKFDSSYEDLGLCVTEPFIRNSRFFHDLVEMISERD